MKHAMTALLLVASLVGCGPKVELAADTKTAATQCYVATLGAISTDPIVDREGLRAMYFGMLAVRGDAGGASPPLKAYGAFTNDKALVEKYKAQSPASLLPKCEKRFPRSVAATALPAEPNERAALCYYAATWTVGLMKGLEAKDSGVAGKAKRTADGITDAVANRIADHFGLKSGADGDVLRAKLLAQSVDIGTMAAIMDACPAP